MKRIIFLLCAFLLASCTVETAPLNVTRLPSSTAVPHTATTPESQLVGTWWELVEMNGRPLVPGSRITLIFYKEFLGGFAGCNEYGGAFTIAEDGTIRSPRIGANDVDCAEPLYEQQEQAYLAALHTESSTISDGHLEMTSADGQTTLLFAPQARFDMNPADLIGTAWQLTAWEAHDLPSDGGITLVFLNAEQMRGYDGCRHYEGTYRAENDSIRFSLGMVDEGCLAEPDGQYPDWLLTSALGQIRQYRQQEGRLQLFTNPSDVLLFEPFAPEAAILGSDCGPTIITVQDVACALVYLEPAQKQTIDEQTTLLFADPQAPEKWAGPAILFHAPTRSMLVMDRFGDVLPQASMFSSRAGVAALSGLAGDAGLMAGIQQEVQQRWQTAPTGEAEIRLGTAWQDGRTTIFLIAVAGLAADDDRFYCPAQTWTIDDVTVEIVADCIAQEVGIPVHHVLFEAQQIQGDEQFVQVALDGLPSNELRVSEGVVAQETSVYQAALRHLSNRALLLRGETAHGLEVERLAAAVNIDLLQNYLLANGDSTSLRFLFQNSNNYFVTPGSAVDRDFLPNGDSPEACAQFHEAYPGLGGGVVTLSGIGFSDDGTEALLHIFLQCGPNGRSAAYLMLDLDDDIWQVREEFTAPPGSFKYPIPIPNLAYTNDAQGCGDIFLYQSNSDRSEFITVSIQAEAFDLSPEPLTIDLAAHPEAAQVWIDTYADSIEKLGENPYCNDVGPAAQPQSVWQAVSGSLTLSVSPGAETEPCAGDPYQTTVLMENVTFGAGAETFILPTLTFEDVTVGWCAG